MINGFAAPPAGNKLHGEFKDFLKKLHRLKISMMLHHRTFTWIFMEGDSVPNEITVNSCILQAWI